MQNKSGPRANLHKSDAAPCNNPADEAVQLSAGGQMITPWVSRSRSSCLVCHESTYGNRLMGSRNTSQRAALISARCLLLTCGALVVLSVPLATASGRSINTLEAGPAPAPPPARPTSVGGEPFFASHTRRSRPHLSRAVSPSRRGGERHASSGHKLR